MVSTCVSHSHRLLFVTFLSQPLDHLFSAPYGEFCNKGWKRLWLKQLYGWHMCSQANIVSPFERTAFGFVMLPDKADPVGLIYTWRGKWNIEFFTRTGNCRCFPSTSQYCNKSALGGLYWQVLLACFTSNGIKLAILLAIFILTVSMNGNWWKCWFYVWYFYPSEMEYFI